MKTIPLIFALLFISLCFGFAQEAQRGFGNISLEDFNFIYEKDPKVSAIVLFDKGNTEFVVNSQEKLEIEFKREKRILIKNKKGLAYADISIPYYTDGYGKTEKVSNIAATTYYLINGSLQKVDLKKEQIFTEKTNEKWTTKKFAMPKAAEGAIIEFRYTLNSPFIFQLPDWVFQSSIPTLYSSYDFSLVPFYEYVFLLQGINKFDEYHSEKVRGRIRRYAGIEFHDMRHTAIMKDIPAFEDESYITSIDDYIMKMDFQLAKVNDIDGSKREILTTYPKLIHELRKHPNFGKYMNKAKKLSKSILEKELNLTGKTKVEKCEIIINYVKEKMDWDGKSRKYTEQSPKEVFLKKRGSSAEINLFLVALLKSAEIEAYPVIFSTRSHGKIHKTYPFDHHFNSVIAYIRLPEKEFLADGTEPLVPYNRLPVRCMNDEGLVIKDGDVTWVNMYSKINSKLTYRISLNPDLQNKHISAKIRLSSTEVDGFFYRAFYGNDEEKIKNDLTKNEMEDLQNIITENFIDREKPYKINYDCVANMETYDDKILIAPFLNLPPSENQLKQKSRTYPVDFIYKKSRNYGCQITIPEGYKVLDLPEKLMVNNELVQIVYDAKIVNQSINVTGSYTYKKAVYPAATYSKLKSLVDTIVEKFNEQIVLQRM